MAPRGRGRLLWASTAARSVDMELPNAADAAEVGEATIVKASPLIAYVCPT